MRLPFRRCFLVFIVVITAAAPATSEPIAAEEFKLEEGFTSLFNGTDLTGWEYGPVPVTNKPIIETLAGKSATQDQVFEVKDGLIVATGKRTMASIPIGSSTRTSS